MSEQRAHDPNLAQVIATYLATADGKKFDELVMEIPGTGKVLIWHTYLPKALKVLDIVGDYLMLAAQAESGGNVPEKREEGVGVPGGQEKGFDALAAETEAEAGDSYKGADSAARSEQNGRPKL